MNYTPDYIWESICCNTSLRYERVLDLGGELKEFNGRFARCSGARYERDAYLK
jgi:hypothetical protein